MEYVNVDVQTSKALKCFPINFSWKVAKFDGHSLFSFEVIHILIVEAAPTPFHALHRLLHSWPLLQLLAKLHTISLMVPYGWFLMYRGHLNSKRM